MLTNDLAHPNALDQAGEPNHRATEVGRTSAHGFRPPVRILVVGVGNELLTDDGVGIHALRQLQDQASDQVTVLELGTAILHGLSWVESADRILVLDAVKGGQPPGTVYRFEAPSGYTVPTYSSVHALGLREAANLLLPGPVPPITILGVEPSALEYGMTLSSPVQSALPLVLSLARETLAHWRQAQPLEDPAPLAVSPETLSVHDLP